MEQTKFPAQIISMVSKVEILGNDTTLVVNDISIKIFQFLELEKEISDMSVEEKVKNGEMLIQRTSRIHFSISGYDEEPQPLWNFPEIRNWIWTWMKKQPYCILFLEDQYTLLLSLLCLGGVKSQNYNGFIPDFRSNKAPEFKALLNDSLGILLMKYDNPWLLGAFAMSRHSNLVPQFQEMEKETI